VQHGQLVVLPGIVGCGEAMTWRWIQEALRCEKASPIHQRNPVTRHSPIGFPIAIAKICTPDNIALFDRHLACLEKRGDTVGEPTSKF
jgi:hypothetical protein